MTRKKFLLLNIPVIVAILIMNFTYCRKDKYLPSICYDKDIQPILTNKCALSGCHNSNNVPSGLNFTSYSAFESNKKKYLILEMIEEGRMPPIGKPQLSKEEKKMIAKWASIGYGKGDCSNNTSSSCDTTASITYNNNVKVIFDTYCIGCHNTSTLAGGYSLDNYTGAKNCAQSGRLLGAIQWLAGYSPMPKGGNKLSNCDIAIIRKWINSGMPN